MNVLIFDLDGTILSSGKPIFEAIKRAFHKMGLVVSINVQEIES